jgi:hypothetical protein
MYLIGKLQSGLTCFATSENVFLQNWLFGVLITAGMFNNSLLLKRIALKTFILLPIE